MKKKLTPANVLTLPTLKTRSYQCWDTGSDAALGLSVLVSPNGVRTYRATYYYPGSPKPKGMKLGRVGEMSLDDAREKTREVRGLARKGFDPKKGDPTRSSDFKTAIETWTLKEQLGRKQNKSAEDCERFILSSTKAWHQRPAATIMHHEIEDLLHAKRDMGHGYAANRLHAHLATFFKWCLRTERLQVDPMRNMPSPWQGGQRRQKPWFKGAEADEVIRKLWLFADQIGGDWGRYIKAILIVGKRRNAVLTMQWEHIDATWFWTPTIGNKRKRCNPIPLPKLLQKVLGPRKKTGLVFSSMGHRNLLGAVRKGIGVPDFIWHGTRHIFQTKLGELRVAFHVRSMLMDHRPPMDGSDANYDHHTYSDELLAGLETWCAHIERVTAPKAKAAQPAKAGGRKRLEPALV